LAFAEGLFAFTNIFQKKKKDVICIM